ncbi:MAG: hypothetical protein NC218_08625 [Acetobacter sp.]|nr:hypothetical protein [Acetobacter sp.]
MTEKKNTPKRKIIDWNKKSGDDASRISKRMQQREELADSATITNDATKKNPPRATGLPLLRLRQKIKEVYDEEEEEEDTPLFNINLLGEEEETKNSKQIENLTHITKQQELTGRLNVIMSTALVAEEAGLPSKMTTQDNRLADSPEQSLKQIRRQTMHQKVEKPLGLQGELPEKNLKKSIKGIKKAQKTLPDNALQDYPADKLDEFIELDKEDMAKLILKKSGRRGPKKKLSEIAKGLNQFKNIDSPETNDKENA